MNAKTASQKHFMPQWLQHPDKVVSFLLIAWLVLFVLDSKQGLQSVYFVINALVFIAPIH